MHVYIRKKIAMNSKLTVSKRVVHFCNKFNALNKLTYLSVRSAHKYFLNLYVYFIDIFSFLLLINAYYIWF
ncbi:hypothetical protein KM92DES2_10604 [uncultured Desulfovibrio sp.]|uniref:Uncharacterized protein n=1 Tax=uncultured Desulfovibrio sp. TaxID=167968 RepID=A0A212J6B0_9BACT|nr:hypothetical protein KM92DES2_10604 [uncultured Desulfovibrio sp.]